MKIGIAALIAACLLGAQEAPKPGAEPAQSGPAGKEASASRQELLKLLGNLELKLPPELARKVVVISMKLATGWCSPYATKELEDEVEKLPAAGRKKFADEWDAVRKHPLWPRLPAKEEAGEKGKPIS